MAVRVRGIFVLEWVEVSSDGVDMLACRVVNKHGVLHTMPAMKPLQAPLDSQSAHPHAIHSWPVGVLRSRIALCSDPDDRLAATNRFIERFRITYAPSSKIRALERIAASLRNGTFTSARRSDRRLGGMWLVLGYHPLLHGDLQRRLRRFLGNEFWMHLLKIGWCGDPPNINIAWACVLPRLEQLQS